jgi:hypothetical protein
MDSVNGLYVDGAVDAAGGQQAFNDVTSTILKARMFVMRRKLHKREIREAEEALQVGARQAACLGPDRARSNAARSQSSNDRAELARCCSGGPS